MQGQAFSRLEAKAKARDFVLKCHEVVLGVESWRTPYTRVGEIQVVCVNATEISLWLGD